MQFGKRKGTVQRKLADDQERPVVANEPRRSFEGVEVRRASAHRFLWQSHAPEQVSASHDGKQRANARSNRGEP